MKTITLIAISTFLILGCQTEKHKEVKRFQTPIVSTKIDFEKAAEFVADSLPDNSTIFVGVYSFSDSVFILPQYDTSTYNAEQLNQDRSKPWENSVYSSGLQIIPDFHQTIFITRYPDDTAALPYYPIFLPNETSDTLQLLVKDRYVLAIAEVLHTDGDWYPIQQRPYDFCGVGYWKQLISPGEFSLFLMPKYSGQTEAMMRIRLQSGETTLLSRPFLGKFDTKQLYMKKSEKEMLVGSEFEFINYVCLGSAPLELKSFKF